MKQKFDVTGMTCSACSAHVEKAVNKLEGVRRAEVSLMTNSMNVEYDEAVKHIHKIFKPDKLRMQDSLARIIVLECHDDTEHRNDTEEKQP